MDLTVYVDTSDNQIAFVLIILQESHVFLACSKTETDRVN